MKKFYFKDEFIRPTRYGGSIREITIYQLFKNDLHFIGQLRYNTASTLGNTSEVHCYLIEKGYITIQEAKKQTKPIASIYNERGYSNYYYYDHENEKQNKYVIKEI